MHMSGFGGRQEALRISCFLFPVTHGLTIFSIRLISKYSAICPVRPDRGFISLSPTEIQRRTMCDLTEMETGREGGRQLHDEWRVNVESKNNLWLGSMRDRHAMR